MVYDCRNYSFISQLATAPTINLPVFLLLFPSIPSKKPSYLVLIVVNCPTMTPKQSPDLKILKQPLRRRELDRARKANQCALQRIERKKEMFLRSFKEDNNVFTAHTRLDEMSALSSGVLTGVDGLARFTTFPNANQLKIEHCKRAHEDETQVVGCVPLCLMTSLLNDVKADDKFRSLVPLSQQIGRAPDESESKSEVGRYFMVHWQKPNDESTDEWNEQMVVDWKVTNKVHKIFSVMAVGQIESFGFSILKALGLHANRTTHLFGPGVVYTETPFHQRAHADFDEVSQEPVKKSWILHMPLQREGMLLSIWEAPIADTAGDNSSMDHKYTYVPFGSYIALRSDVLHSGVYGSSGNVRFHMILKSRNNVQVVAADQAGRDSLFYFTDKSDEERPAWLPAFNASQKQFKVYAENYIEELQRHTGPGVEVNALLKCIQFRGEQRKRKKAS
jgi:hypothetical protein